MTYQSDFTFVNIVYNSPVICLSMKSKNAIRSTANPSSSSLSEKRTGYDT
jgi:hypothetical protein